MTNTEREAQGLKLDIILFAVALAIHRRKKESPHRNFQRLPSSSSKAAASGTPNAIKAATTPSTVDRSGAL